MDEQDPRIPAPRRAPLFRRSVSPDPEPRVADLSALLADIDALRTTLSTDLSLAAAALEAGADGVAAEVVANDLDELHAFEHRSLARLSALGDAARTPAEVVPLRRRGVLAAAPLVAAAAAVVGLFAGVVPNLTPSPAPTTTVDGLSQAGYSLAVLSDLAESGASSDQVASAADQLNDEVEDLLARAGSDPLAARQALMLLSAGSLVLTGQADQGALSAVLARTRELEAVLRRVLPSVPVSVAPVPGVAQLPVTRPAPQSPAPRPSTSPSSRPTPSPSPTGSTTTPPPAPTSSPTPTSTPAPSPSASSSPAIGNPFEPANLPDYS